VIVRWGLGLLEDACAEAGVSSPLLVASPRWDSLELPVEPAGRWQEVPSDRISEAVAAARGADGLLAVGGGSAIDLGKAISAAAGLPLVSVPTTYAGAEWTTYFGVRDPQRRMRGGGGGAHPTAIVYEPELTLDLAGARLISEWLPRVVSAPRDLEARTELLRGACHGGAALAGSMLALAHAIAQAIGGAYGLPHGTLNGISLAPVLRFNAAFAPEAVARFAEAVGAPADPAGRIEALASLAGPSRLRELGVPEADLPGLAADAAQRGGNLANPKSATPEEIERLLRDFY
jgi:maleylacetate reductase